jgi:hypothetical protein
MALPAIIINTKVTMYGLPESGKLRSGYGPFINLLKDRTSSILEEELLGGLRIPCFDAGINITEPVDLQAEYAYDDSLNLIVNDKVNPPKLVNSRFYLTDSTNYKVADRKGNIDTNIYSINNFKSETSLVKIVKSVVKLDFLGLSDNGNMPVGSYIFYFRLSDADGNESDFISESAPVVCHIGVINNPKAIRGGLKEENSNKLIQFKLRDLDLAYDYINVYYSKSSDYDGVTATKFYRVLDKIRIYSSDVNFNITGFEKTEEISEVDLNIQYSHFDSCATSAVCQNINFVGNITKDYELFKILEQYSLLVTPQIFYDDVGIGNLDNSYQDESEHYEYYNVKNTYYKLGY